VAPVAPVAPVCLRVKVKVEVPVFFQTLGAAVVAPLRIHLAAKAQDTLYCGIAVRMYPAHLLLAGHHRLGPSALQTEPGVRVALFWHFVGCDCASIDFS